MLIRKSLLLALAPLFVLSGNLDAAGASEASPPGRDLRHSNFRSLLRGGQSAGSAGAAPPSSGQSAPSAPAASGGAPAGASSPQSSQTSNIPYCDEVPGSSGGSGASGGSAPAGGAAPSGGAPSGGAPSGGAPSGGAPASGTPSSGAPSTGAPSAGGGGQSPTYEQFCAAVDAYSLTSAGGHPPKPSQEIYNEFVKYVSSTLSLKEQAMFLANSIWETGGLQYMKEIACSNGSCTYGKYYGRGFIQLTWDYNYKAASQAIYGDESTLLNNPDLAATPEGAWRTALWFWNTKVSPVLKQNNAVESYKLGYSIKVINGGLECPANEKAQNRMKIFNEILKQWNIDSSSPGKMEGC